MNLQGYREWRQSLRNQEPKYRGYCLTCRQPDFACYCAHIKKFDPAMKFIILIHPIEIRRRIATGRMSHLCMTGSRLILGVDYSQNKEVEAILKNPNYYSIMLYPGPSSTNITPLHLEERRQLFPQDKELVVFVVDGTWNTARKTVRVSDNLKHLPQISFSPPSPSNFRVRTQPKPECYSTLEAIHHTIELLGPGRGFDTSSRRHDTLLSLFDRLVEQPLAHVRVNHSRHRRKIARGLVHAQN